MSRIIFVFCLVFMTGCTTSRQISIKTATPNIWADRPVQSMEIEITSSF